MPEPTLRAKHVLDDLVSVGTFGRPGLQGVHLKSVRPGAVIAIEARAGVTSDLAEAVRNHLGIALPSTRGATERGGVTAICTAPGQWMLLGSDRSDHMALLDANWLEGGVTDLTGSRAMLDVSGPSAWMSLSKFLPIDMDPDVFTAGSAASTLAAHFDVLVWRTINGESYRLACYRSFGVALWSTLTAAASEFGYRVSPPVD